MWLICIIAAIIIVFVILLFKNLEVDLILKYYELFGKTVEELRGQVVWITGASSGLGEYLAYELAGAGCKLVLSARRRQELERVKAKCCEIAGKKLKDFDGDNDFLVLPLDLCKFDTHKEAVKTVLSHFNQIDILVNNSGRLQRGLVIDTELKVDQEIFELNVMGTISITKAVLPHMVENKAGQIVVVSSVAGKFGCPLLGTYSSTKFALQGYFNSLRTEVCGNGIDVSIVCSGPVHSAIVENSATEKPGETLKDKGITAKVPAMATDKFARLMGIAMVNKLDECWISIPPVLLAVYISQYMPNVHSRMTKASSLKNMQNSWQIQEKKEN